LAEQGKKGIRGRIRRWALRRYPRSRRVVLTQNRIFILPTRAGAGFMLLLVLMLLMGINYENNLVYAITFLAAGVFLVSCLHTYGNLAGIELKALGGRSCFATGQAGFELELDHRKGQHPEQILLMFEQGEAPVRLDLEQRCQRVELFCPAPRRGWLDPGGLRLETTFPLGLFRAWTWINLEIRALIYPQPLKGYLPAGVGGGGSSDRSRMISSDGRDDFTGLERYQPGMSPRQIDWKSYARGQGLQAKQFGDQQSPDIWLDLEACPGNLEERLSRLTYWVLELAGNDQRFGLRLRHDCLPPGQGPEHRHEALRRLALYGQGGDA